MKHTELIERLRGVVQKLRRTSMPIADVAPMVSEAADAIEALEAEVERIGTELAKAQDELNCTESTLEAASCDLPSAAFDNGFDCMGDFAMAVWQGFKSERDALKLDAERYLEKLIQCRSSVKIAANEFDRFMVRKQPNANQCDIDEQKRLHDLLDWIDTAMKGAA